uniref:Uncharacterized protein LOC111110477 isoform X3 n=1 Tax=Crassostrea virginica TaxID=6565 RepID=A0A8B8BIA6_CRAVI|nr:uncharacterized protein LOC111110477 isoform X3 [Crassostrea virginica]
MLDSTAKTSLPHLGEAKPKRWNLVNILYDNYISKCCNLVITIQLVLIHWTTINFAALPTWVHRVHKCPDPNRLRDWLEAAKKLNCLHNLTSNDHTEQKRVYHCLPSSFLNETVEFCGENVPIESGKCPVYNYAVHQNTRPTSYNCSKFVSGCPQEVPLWSKEVYKYPACLNLNKIEKCFEAEKDCKNSSDNGIPITNEPGKTGIPITNEPGKTGIPITNEPGKTFTVIVLSVFLGLVLIVLVGTIAFILRKGKCSSTSYEMDQTFSEMELTNVDNEYSASDGHTLPSNEASINGKLRYENIASDCHTPYNEASIDSKPLQNGGVCNQTKQAVVNGMWEQAQAWKSNELVEKLTKTMTKNEFKRIKNRLEDHSVDGPSEVCKLPNRKELLKYLIRKFPLPHNVMSLQGLFELCEAKTLYEICCEYAKSKENEDIMYFSKNIQIKGCTRVEYTIHCPDQSSYTQADLQKLRETVAMWTNANYDEIIICEIRRGSVIVSFMIKNRLIPKLQENQHKIADSLKHSVMKVKITDTIIDESEILPPEDKIPIPRFFCKKTEKSSSKIHKYETTFSSLLYPAAIDIGTTSSSCSWKAPSSYYPILRDRITGISPRISTTILLDNHQKLVDFGPDAEKKYSDLSANEEKIFYYFHQFKLLLYDKARTSKLTIDTKISDIRGREMEATTVFSQAIQYLKKIVLREVFLAKKKEIIWILTVPAIWGDTARLFLRIAARKAGISEDQLMIVSEAEAVFMYYKQSPTVELNQCAFQPGINHLVLDAGGETIDIAVFEVDNDGYPMELYCACDLDCGGKRVDMAFENALSEIFTEEVIHNYRDKYIEDYNKLLKCFEFEKKRRRYEKETSGQLVSFKFPASFIEESTKTFGTDLTTLTKQSRFSDHLSWEKNLISIDIETFEGFFQPACDEIIKLVKKVLMDAKCSNVQYILMAGEFSESPLLQDAIQKAFPQLQVIASPEAGRAVLCGALSYVLHQMKE